ncbi:hypothetical protein J4Q44_G00141350 [Coregonus suidteri]|uniref:EF-hand domain-containing protein n=1 Tax=Coregonus suidteri TaxID=861788 RepID=A0AAN8M0T5_9TELE
MSDSTLFRATRILCRSISSDMEESEAKGKGGAVPMRKSSDRRGSDWGSIAMLDKTKEFFQTCDVEGKGFITRTDMRRLHRELPLSAEELENVFDSLDTDQNGYLTLEVFSSGFSQFLHGRRISVAEDAVPALPTSRKPSEALYQSQWDERLTGGGEDDEDDEESHFCMLLESLGASNVFQDPGEVRSLWAQLRRDEPHLLSNFEEFLARVTFQIKEAKDERREMESALQRAVLHVILRDHYSSFKSEKRVGNVYSKATSFVDYVWKALRRLELDESKLSDGVIQSYHDTYRPRMVEMEAFNMLKVTLAPCIEGLILLDRLCYLKEQVLMICLSQTLKELCDSLHFPDDRSRRRGVLRSGAAL